MSDDQNPVAWHVTGDGYEYSTLLEEHARAIVEEEGGMVTPLYRSPTLTDEEREAVERAADLIDAKTCGDSATLRGLLERLGDTPDTHAAPSKGSEQDRCTLTDAELEAVEFFAVIDTNDGLLGGHIATLRELLERHKASK